MRATGNGPANPGPQKVAGLCPEGEGREQVTAVAWLLLLGCILVTIGLLKDRPEDRWHRKILVWGAWVLIALLAFFWSMQSDIDARRERGAALLQEAEGPLSRLVLLADTEEEFKRLVAAAEELYEMGGARSLAEAARIVFELEDAGKGWWAVPQTGKGEKP